MIKDLLLYFALLLWFVVPLQAQPTIFAEDVEAKPGDRVEVLIKVEDFTDIVAWQFTFEWDSLVLEFVDFGQMDLVALDTFDFGPENMTSYIISAWVEPALNSVSLPDDHVVFSMFFDVIGEPTDTSMLAFTGSELPNIVAVNGVSTDLLTKEGTFTVMESTNSAQDVPIGFDLSISPNPFYNTTQIKFNLEEPYADFNVSIYSLDGREVFQQTYDFSAGEQTINIEANMLPTTGMYLLNMTSENLHTTHKLLFENY